MGHILTDEAGFCAGFGKWFHDLVFVAMRSAIKGQGPIEPRGVLELCGGVGSGILAERCLGVPCNVVGYYDTEVLLKPWLMKIHGPELRNVHLGSLAGGITGI